jgi:two-component system, chemotaxis family, protein-glutamate methylesterase/glutaminase
MDESPQNRTRRVIGIVAASGGPPALLGIMRCLPRALPLPILIIQSIAHDYLQQFVARLSDSSDLTVTAAQHGEFAEPGRVYVSSGKDSMSIERGCLRLEPAGTPHNPKDDLFRSMAREAGPGAIAVVLTGMGWDGAHGMKAVRDAGGYTIAQDAATSLIYNAPRQAVKVGAVCELLPIQDIAPRLLALVSPGVARPR